MGKTRQVRSKREALDGGLRRARQLEQRDSLNYSDMAFRDGADSDGENFLVSAF